METASSFHSSHATLGMTVSELPFEKLTGRIIGAAITVHRALGPGLFEAVYEECLCVELKRAGLVYRRQVPINLSYDGAQIQNAYQADLIVDDLVLVELKSVERLAFIHRAQVLTYIKLAKLPAGLVINFNVPLLRDGVRRVFNQ